MKRTGKVTLSAIMAALSATFMVTSFFPYLTYAIPAIAGLFIMIVVIEIGAKWGVLAFITASVIVFILPADAEAKLLYISFFGYYPILKAALETKCSRVVEYIFKFLVFNVAIIVSYTVFATVFSIDIGDMGEYGKYTPIILLALANIVFPIYDVAVGRMAGFYISRLHKSVSRIFNKN